MIEAENIEQQRQQQEDEKWMLHALSLARQAQALGEVPVGAVVVLNNEVVGEGFNQPIVSQDPSAHAEIMALRDAAKKLNNYRLPNCSLYVTIEPCAMCAGAIIHARLAKLIFGAAEPRAGAVVSQLQLLDATHTNHRTHYLGGILEAECRESIKRFFRHKRSKK